jgi:hypothetical protein
MNLFDDGFGALDGADERHLIFGGGLEPGGYVVPRNKQRVAGRHGIRVPQSKNLIVAEKNAIF